MDLALFSGKLHPILVHLPIGFLLLACVFEIIGRKSKAFDRAIRISLGIGLLASIAAAITGLLLEQNEAFPIRLLQSHKVAGLTVLAVAAAAFLCKTFKKHYPVYCSWIGVGVLALTLAVAGHLGGELTHGRGYFLVGAPPFVKKMFDDSWGTMNLTSHPDSIVVYKDLVRPILNHHCVSCHNAYDSEGGLDLSSYDLLFASTAKAVPINRGKPEQSELFKRITLPHGHKEFMPPGEKGLTFTQIAIIRHWISSGADSASKFVYAEMSPVLTEAMEQEFNIDFRPKPYYEQVEAEPVPEELLSALNELGIETSYIGESNFLLNVDGRGQTVTAAVSKAVSAISGNVCFLDLAESQIEELGFIAAMPHLVSLDLHESNIDDDLLKQVTESPQLEVLNLYGTKVSPDGLDVIDRLPALKRLYLWQTAVTEDEMAELRSAHPDLEIIGGLAFKEE